MADIEVKQRIVFSLMQTLVLAILDYRLGLLKVSHNQVDRVEINQNGATRAV